MRKREFTLVELLIVIAIILILAGILIPTVNGAIKKADQTKAKAQMTTLINAIKQFEATYGYLPTQYYDGSTKKTLMDADTVKSGLYGELIKILQNEETSSSKINVKGQRFLDVVGNNPGEYKDPWENDFLVRIDTDNDGKVTGSNIDGLNNSADLYQSVVIWSLGADEDDYQDNVYSFPVE